MKVRKKLIVWSCILFALVAFILWVIWANTALELNTYKISSKSLPYAFDGYRIAQVSDLHNTEMGDDNENLISILMDAKPNIIVITGDMIDSRDTNVEIALRFAEQAVRIAPCYYVSGNHEARVEEYQDLKNGLLQLGVFVLDDEKILLENFGEQIAIIGLSDPNFGSGTSISNRLSNFVSEDDCFAILLSHHPEFFAAYVESGVDLVFSGHAHGGQFRLPFIGGFYAPNQGLFPDYDSGVYSEGNTCMLVSRGIGNSIIPLRFNNRPEVILVELCVE